MGHTPRSTVGTVTEIYDYLAHSRWPGSGTPYCPTATCRSARRPSDEIVDKILAEPAGTKLYLMAPLRGRSRREVRNAVGRDALAGLRPRAQSTGRTHSVDDPAARSTAGASTLVEVVIDRIEREARRALAESPRAWRTRCRSGRGRECTSLIPRPTCHGDRSGATETHSQHCRDKCGRSFDTAHAAQLLVQQFARLVHRLRQGLGTQTGANPAGSCGDPEAHAGRWRGHLRSATVEHTSLGPCDAA